MITRDIERWLRPWPIAFKNKTAKWDLNVLPLSRCQNLYAFWDVHGEFRRVKWWVDRAFDGNMPGNQHYIHGIARFQVPVMQSLTILVCRKDGKDVVVDGNHHLISTLLAKKRDDTCPITHVGVLKRRGK